MSFEVCPRANEGCRYAPDCYSDEHHFYYPRKRYKTSIERAFRALPENRAMMCREEHSELHATEPIPPKPSRDEMLQALASIAFIEEAS